jgi:serine/threonine protein kinase
MQVVQEIQNEVSKSHVVQISNYFMKGTDHLGQRTINQYSISKKLGKGAYGTVFLAHMNETHYDYAMKIFNKNVLRGIKDFVKDEKTGRMK